MPYLVRQTTEGLRHMIRDGTGHDRPLKWIGREGYTYFENLPDGVIAGDPAYDLHEVEGEGQADAIGRAKGIEIDYNLVDPDWTPPEPEPGAGADSDPGPDDDTGVALDADPPHSLAELHWTQAVAMVKEETDPDVLEAFAAIESRDSVLTTIRARLKSLAFAEAHPEFEPEPAADLEDED